MNRDFVACILKLLHSNGGGVYILYFISRWIGVRKGNWAGCISYVSYVSICIKNNQLKASFEFE